MNEAVNNLNSYWLEPVRYFELENSMDLQFDLPITPKAFLFRSFDKIVNVYPTDKATNQVLFAFYLKYMRPPYKTWSSRKITVVKVFSPIETESFLNARFKVSCGAVSSTQKFTLVDLPCLNLFNWISLLLLLMKDQQKYELIITHLKRMSFGYSGGRKYGRGNCHSS